MAIDIIIQYHSRLYYLLSYSMYSRKMCKERNLLLTFSILSNYKIYIQNIKLLWIGFISNFWALYDFVEVIKSFILALQKFSF